VADLVKPLRRALIFRALTRSPVRAATALVRDSARIFRRWFRPSGMVLVILGADGSGKSTVGAQLIERLRPSFSPGKGLQVHWKPVVFFRKRRQPSGKPNTDPHGQPPRGWLASLCYLAGHWLEYVLGSLLQFRPAMFRGGLVLIDRYYYDFLIDQRRYRLSVPNGIIRLLFRTLRQPDLVFLLDAPAEVLQARKREVSPAETERQVQAYRQLVATLPQGRTLDATAPPYRVTAELTRQLLDWLASRIKNR
jgi:thymidylate kinase